MFIILDRDGVINFESEEYIKTPEEWVPIPGSLEAIAHLSALGHTLVVATNQAGVGRGYYSEDTLARIHDKMQRVVSEAGGKLTRIYYCPHAPWDHCNCRKPKPGMLLKIAEDFQTDLREAIFVGDTRRDIEAALAVECSPVLVRTGYGLETLESIKGTIDVPVFDDLLDFSINFFKS